MINPRKITDFISLYFHQVFKTFEQRRIFWGISFFIIVFMIIASSVIPENIDLQEGQPSPRDFNAPRSITFESQVLTSIARQEAADKVEPVYRTDESILIDIQEQIDGYFLLIKDLRDSENLTTFAKAEELKEKLDFHSENGLYEKLITIETSQLERIQLQALQAIGQIMLPGVMQSDIELARKNIQGNISLLTISNLEKEILNFIIDNLELQGNRIYDDVATLELKEKAMDRVAPVAVSLTKEQKIVGKGEIVTLEKLETLKRLGMHTNTNTVVPIMGVILFVLIFCGSILLYMYLYCRDLLEDELLLVLIGLLIISTLLVEKGITSINLGGQAEYSGMIAYMVPVAAGSMLIAILLNTRLSIFITTFLAIIVGVTNGFELQFAFVAFLGGMAGIYSVTSLSQRSDLAMASVYIVGANIIAILSLSLIFNYSVAVLGVSMLLGTIGGVLSSVLTIGSLPFWESAFGVTTSVKLLELSNPNQPLLRRLLIEAPGTYHHSVVVGNLAEAAASAVNADALLTRVGANYHDIGKIKRPYFFIENQLSGENPHDKLTPNLSTLIITSHVKDGIELAKEYNLPTSIIDIIEQHHGTTMVSFFFYKAKEGISSEDCCIEEDFRYDYVKPRTKEAAIVMLADSVEAGVRSMQKVTPNKIETFVRKNIKEKLEDGQLEECELTFKELDVIAQSFVAVLAGIFHSRVEYPESVLKEMERSKTDGIVRK